VLNDGVYHLLTPVFRDDVYIGTLDFGVAATVLQSRESEMLWKPIGIFLLLLGGALGVFALVFQVWIASPTKRLLIVGQQLSQGKPVQSFQIGGRHDEIAAIGTMFHRIANYIHEVTQTLIHISRGNVEVEVAPRSEGDQFGLALRDMVPYFQSIASVAQQTPQGDLAQSLEVRTDEDTLGQAIHNMTHGLRVLIEHIKTSADTMTSTGALIHASATHDNSVVHAVYAAISDMSNAIQHVTKSIENVVEDLEKVTESVQVSLDSTLLITASVALIASNAEELTTRSQLTIMALRNAVQGLENTIDNMMKNIIDVIGGTNVILYYIIDNEIFYADVIGEKAKIDKIDDILVSEVLETNKPIEYKHDFKDTKMHSQPIRCPFLQN
jgi:methyl-accepting chemotaxis protein